MQRKRRPTAHQREQRWRELAARRRYQQLSRRDRAEVTEALAPLGSKQLHLFDAEKAINR